MTVLAVIVYKPIFEGLLRYVESAASVLSYPATRGMLLFLDWFPA